MERRKIALLDTDFISKMHFVQKDDQNPLIDRILELPEYQFFCHEQIVKELVRHNKNAPAWLAERIGEQRIICYSDKRIVTELKGFLGSFACMKYTEILKTCCEAFSSEYFPKYYRKLEESDDRNLSTDAFLTLLKKFGR